MAVNASTAAVKSNCPIKPTARLFRSTSSGVTAERRAVRHDGNEAIVSSNTRTRNIDWHVLVALATSAYFMRHFAGTAETPVTLKTLCGYGAALLLANTAYIAAAASPTVFYMANVLAHVVVGTAVWIAALALVARDRAFRDNWLVRIAVAALTIAVVLAAEIVRRGNLLELRWVLIAHIATAAVAVAAFLPFAWQLARRGSRSGRRFGTAFQAGTALLVLVPAGAAMWTAARPNPDDRIVNPPMAPLSMHEAGGGPRAPLLPSAAQTHAAGTI